LLYVLQHNTRVCFYVAMGPTTPSEVNSTSITPKDYLSYMYSEGSLFYPLDISGAS